MDFGEGQPGKFAPPILITGSHPPIVNPAKLTIMVEEDGGPGGNAYVSAL